ncbi:MAG: Fic family protein [Betaproteobacteria bacterium]|nr:Fic family protein [Betaproteobacteria bacterium]
MTEPIWVLIESVKAIHNRQIAEHGGTTGVRDSELLESALAKPKNIYLYSKSQSSIPSLASAYAYAISKNHPFLDGNKRVALVVSIAFIDELLLWFESVSKSDTF